MFGTLSFILFPPVVHEHSGRLEPGIPHHIGRVIDCVTNTALIVLGILSLVSPPLLGLSQIGTGILVGSGAISASFLVPHIIYNVKMKCCPRSFICGKYPT